MGAKRQPQAWVREASGTVCLQTRMVARRRTRAAGSRPRDRTERLLLLFDGKKQEKMDDGRSLFLCKMCSAEEKVRI